jgi:glycosyltransferase involved in cell wall biosynthesis
VEPSLRLGETTFVLILHTESSHGWGGQEIRILTESRELLRHGYEVIVLAGRESLIASRAQEYGVPVVRTRLRKKSLLDLAAVFQAIRKLRPAVVSTHSSTDHWLVAVVRHFFFRQIAIVRTRHISTPVSRNFATRWLYRSGCDFTVTTSRSILEQLTQDGLVCPGRAIAVPTGINLSYFHSRGPEIARLNLAPTVGLNKTSFLFGNIATLRSWKGQIDLINAFATVEPRIPEAKLLIVGDGPMREALRALVRRRGLEQKVHLVGHQSDVRDYFDALDIFVFPSFANEGIPQAILQAMTYGLPIIATNLDPIREALEGYPSVMFVESKNPEKLGTAMYDAARTGKGRIHLPRSVRTRIDINRMTDSMVQLYQRVSPKKC